MRKLTASPLLFTSLLAATAAVAGISAPVVAARRRARVVAAAGGESDADGQDGDSGPYNPPEPLPPPPPPPPAPEPSPTVGLLLNGSKALAALLAATPLAPLAPFVAALGAIFGALANENEKGKHAQPRLLEAIASALQQAEYEGYMEAWVAGRAHWDVGMYETAREHFDNAPAAGRARRLEVAQKIDALEVGSFRAWMARPPGALQSKTAQLWDGYIGGDGGFTGFPLANGDGEAVGWYYELRANGQAYRFHWDESHPDYNGTPYPPLTAAQRAARLADRERLAAARAASELATRTGGVTELQDAKRSGGGVRGRRAASEDELLLDQPGIKIPPPTPPPPPPPNPLIRTAVVMDESEFPDEGGPRKRSGSNAGRR